LFGIAIVEIIEEDASESASFVTMIDDKVSICPGFELGIEFRIVTIAYLLVGSVEMLHIVEVEVGGGDIGAAAESPNSSVGFEVLIVEMHGGTVRISRMHDARQTAGEATHGCRGR
jgi:hypothetical protein